MLPGRQGSDFQGHEHGSAASWSIADDVFQARYQAGGSHIEGAWQPLPQLSLQLDAAAPSGCAAGGRSRTRQQQRRPTASAAAALPAEEPWLLAAAAYASEGGAWTAGRTATTRARMLFQYKPYSQQEPLVASEAEVAAVVEAVFGRWGNGPSAFEGETASLWDRPPASEAAFGLAAGGAPTGEVAAVVLVKLVMDMYVKAGPKAAFPLTLLLLQAPLLRGDPAVQARVFDVLYNLSVHGELLYDAAAEAVPEDAPALAEAVAELDQGDGSAAALNWKATVTAAFRATLAATIKAQHGQQAATRSSLDGRHGGGTLRSSLDGRTFNPRGSLEGRPLNNRGSFDARSSLRGNSSHAAGSGGGSDGEWPPLLGQRPPARSAATERFQQWLRLLLFQLMAALAASGSTAEGPWAAALSCLLHLGTHGGRVVRAYVEELPLSVVAALLQQSRTNRWSEQLHAWLVTLAANLLYVHSDGSVADSQRSGGTGGGGAGYAAYASGNNGELSWWAGSQLDPERLAAFGGMRQVLRCFREAPTALARRSMFAVLYDHVVSGQGSAGEDAWAPVLMQQPHSSEALALGAALLRMGAAEAVHPLFLAGISGTMQPLADAISTQMVALQASNRGRVVSVPAALVTECMECLEEMATADLQVPAALQEAVKHTLEAVTAPDAARSTLSSAESSAVWGALADCMRDPSDLGSRAGRGWLVQLLVAAAEHELARSSSPQGGEGGTAGTAAAQQQQKQQRQDGGEGGDGSASTPRLGGQRSQDSLAEAEASAAKVVASESATSVHSPPFDAQGSGWRALDCPEVVVGTLSLAVEWLLQAPQEARQGAMLRATELLLAFTLAPHRQQLGGGGSGGGPWRSGSGLQAPEGSAAAQEGGPATPLTSPAVRPAAAQLRLPTPLQLPSSPGFSAGASPLGGPLSPALQQRPLSPSMAALQAAAAAASSGAGGAQQAQQQAQHAQRPTTPRVSSLDRLQGAGEPSAVDIAAAAASVVAAADGAGIGSTAEQLEAAAAVAAEARATQLWSFLNGHATVPQELLRLVPPLLLRTLFEDLRPDASALQYEAMAAAGAGAPAARLARAADAALGVKAGVQADQPLWDARAAVLLLLMARCAADAAALRALGGAGFFSALLSEADARVRHYAAVFVLRQLMLRQPQQYRRALRGVVARAQAANDERLLASPYLQLKAMLGLGSVHLDAL
ncbi:hypothetical protein C2E21_7090 [Chlorella sorokiniana]|uniref:Uncharacterized protein n=1 Tax=Chlorella sorokiniana TaxID=3076 RepID=A0A2P6TJ48_CHLSO|nr:hypothetical protein C2E21_7090 [Chlorella sorokiniana]|eukprot:PRW39232.1 hypothetical protein C2E21_7090 [Chlorella sorokiniana]